MTAGPLAPGSRFGPYEIGERIGQGGMGVVYRAKRGDESVALKLMRSELRDDQDYVRRFDREIRTARGAQHRYLVEIVDGGECDGDIYVASRYLGGGSLADRLDDGPLAVDDVARMLRQVAAALDHLHTEGFVHRDVKPGNIMFDDEGRAHLGDFGLARSEAFSVLTKPGEVMGTVAYLAPELLRGQPAGPSSDLYSLACTAFEALTGRVPFPDDNTLDCVRAQLDTPPPDPRELRPDLSEAVSFAIRKGLAKDPSERPGTAVGLATAVAMGARTSRSGPP